ncbi:unnamed protein product [Caenorhabditis angaria]|uniref:Nuclear pore complex protein n=1 Tax=Caenorhabditis angaria TaxID=860376 RepID=A0A9P1ICJ5_9PELO|nr:unnamed protein product [Caenorhabditis angaria]
MDRSHLIVENEDDRKNQTAFKYMNVYHASLSEKLYVELCSLAFGEYDINEGTSISPVMWRKLYEIFVETENHTRKLPSDAKYSISSQKYANEAVQIASIMNIFTSLPHDYSETQDTSLLSQMITEDIEFRRIYALLLWAEKAISEQQYEQGLTAKVKNLEVVRNSRRNSTMALKRSNFSHVSAKDASIDPDQKGVDEDAQLEQNAMNVMLQLLRSGETAKASEIALRIGMAPIGVQLQLHAMLRNPSDVPLEATIQNQAVHKRLRRAKYFEMLEKLIGSSQKNEDDSHIILLNALRGNLKPMLKISKTPAEKVWAYANSAFLARILRAEGALDEQRICELFNVPLTLRSIISELEAQNNGNGKDVLVLFDVIDSLLNDDVDAFFHLAKEQTKGYVPQDINCNVNVIALDLFFHLVAVSYLSGFEKSPNGDSVIASQFDDLRRRSGTSSHRRMAAFYSRFLDENEKSHQIVETMKLVDSEEERTIFSEALKQCDLDFQHYACSLIKTVRENEKMIPLEEQIGHWQWLLVGGEDTILAAVEEMNRIIRKCLLSEPFNELTVRHIIREAIRFEIPTVLTNVVLSEDSIINSLIDDIDKNTSIQRKLEHASNEFLAFCTFMDLYNFIVTISLKLEIGLQYEPIREEELNMIGGFKKVLNEKDSLDWEASLRVRARAELTLREEAAKRKQKDQRARNEMILQHIENAQPLLRSLLTNIGFRGEYFLAPRENDDPHKKHREELSEIRNRFIPMIILLFAQASSKLDDMLTFLQFFSTFNVDNGDLAIDHQNISGIFTVLADLNMDTE